MRTAEEQLELQKDFEDYRGIMRNVEKQGLKRTKRIM